jgi:mono/diheme cytochrome c family protein
MKTHLVATLLAGLLCTTTQAEEVKPDPEKGKVIYNSIGACMACHGPLGKGDGPTAVALNPKPRSFADGVFKFDTDGDGKTGTDQDLKNILAKGTVVYGGSPLMAPRPDIKEPDVSHLIAYVRSLKVEKK